MTDKRFDVVLSDQILSGFGWRESEVPRGVQEALVMELLRLDRLSEVQAKELLGLDRWGLLETMGRHRVPAIRITNDELDQELAKVNGNQQA